MGLTKREAGVLKLIANGYSNEEIVIHTRLKSSSIRGVVNSIYGKLQLELVPMYSRRVVATLIYHGLYTRRQ